MIRSKASPAAAVLLGALAFLAVAGAAGAAVAGWAEHGETIFLSLASDAWANCF